MRHIACCCSSTGSTNVTDSLMDVARLAWSLHVAQNCCSGAIARRGETLRSVALCSFCFFSFFIRFAFFTSLSFCLFSSFCFSSFSFFLLIAFTYLFLPFSYFPYFLACLFLLFLASPPLLHFPLFTTVWRIHHDASSIVSKLYPRPIALALAGWILLVLEAVPFANAQKL